MKRVLAVACLLMLLASSGAICAPVQWSIEEGGNGHWYEAVSCTLPWFAALQMAQQRSFDGIPGHLGTITSAAENEWVFANVSLPPLHAGNMWLGGYQDRKSPSYHEPDGGWTWITGESWDYTKWHPKYPDNGVINGIPVCDYLYLNTLGNWGDWSYTTASVGSMSGFLAEYEPTIAPPRVLITSPVNDASYVTTDHTLDISGYVSDSSAITSVSWSNDRGGSGTCIGTAAWSAGGIGLQIGDNIITVTAADAAGNTASDIITVVLPSPVQWASTNGGNDHWYEAVAGKCTWFEALLLAQQRSWNGFHGHLATLTSDEENAWVSACIHLPSQYLPGMWLGGYQNKKSPDYTETGGGWSWVTAEPWEYSEWALWYPAHAAEPLFDCIYINADDKWADSAAVPAWLSGYLVEYEPAPIPLNVFITSPTADISYTTPDSVICISSCVSGSNAVTSVSWSNDRGGSGTCIGTTSWSASGISLQAGDNVITVTAVDAAGSTANDTLTVVSSLEDPEVPPDATPVQWAISDGGNGHWYETIEGAYTWFEALLRAQERSVSGIPGHLATITSAAENDWIFANVSLSSLHAGNMWLGGYQDRKTPSYSEPGGGWTWITGETWDYAKWHPDYPDNGRVSGLPMSDYLYINQSCDWGDWSYTTASWGTMSGFLVEYEPTAAPPRVLITSPVSDASYVTTDHALDISGYVSGSATITSVSWSNDRGGSGVCLGTTSWSASGFGLQTGDNVITVTAVDAAGGTASSTLTVVFSPEAAAIQWAISEGGNGHWYEAAIGTYTWFEALLRAQGRSVDGISGHLATITSAAENAWVHANVSLPPEYVQNMWLGGYRDRKDPNCGEPTGGWKWITGETWDYANWYPGNPGMRHYLYITIPGSWGDWNYTTASSGAIPGYLVEYEPTTVPLKVFITQPDPAAPYNTSNSVLRISGCVSGTAAIASLSWSNDRGGNGRCAGIHTWSASGIGLQAGDNVITITATDTAGNSATDTVTVVLPPPTVTTIQWPESEGGNGHWYKAVVGTYTWFEALLRAQGSSIDGLPGHLATFTSAAENEWVHAKLSLPPEFVQNMWIGGYQDRKAPSYSEPGGAWTWITGETWDYAKWDPGYPDNGAAGGLWLPMSDYLYINNLGRWGDFSYTTAERGTIPGYLVEYEQATAPPRVLITSPTTNASYNAYNTYNTSDSVLSIAGYVSDSAAITSVSWSNDRGGSGACLGAASWSASEISLRIGSNVITVTAVDALGNTANDTLVVVRSTDPPPSPVGIRYSVSGFSVSGITDRLTSDGFAEVTNDGGYQKLEYLPYSGLATLPEPGKWYYFYTQPVTIDLEDLGYTGDSGWIPTPRQITVEGQTWSNDSPGWALQQFGCRPWQKIILNNTGVIGISSGASSGSRMWTYDLGPIVVDLGFPNYAELRMGIGTGGTGQAYPAHFEGHAPIAFRYHEVPRLVSIAEAKRLGEGAVVRIKDVVGISADGDPHGFVESSDRTAGIQLVFPDNGWLTPSQRADMVGVMGRVDGQWQLTVGNTIRKTTGDPIKPVCLNTRAIGNDPTETLSYRGLDTTGLLVRYAGRVTAVDPLVFPRIMYIDDGGGYQDGLGIGAGIRVHIPGNIGVSSIPPGGWATVTGISSVEKHVLREDRMVNGNLYPAGTTVYVPSVWPQHYPEDLVVDPPL